MRGKLGTPGSAGSSMDRDSLDDYSAEEMLVLAADGLQLNHMQEEEEEEEEEPPPKSLIVTNVDLSVFLDEQAKKLFEARFRLLDQSVVFYYFRTFRRVRVDFMSHSNASLAKTKLDGVLVGDNTINCYFIRVFAPADPDEVFLQPPPLEKQFLISPPCSPPVGWEQPREGGPVVDYDLMRALAQLAPGEHHELHPSNSVTICGTNVATPSIVVNICEEEQQQQQEDKSSKQPGGRLIQTRCPDRNSSSSSNPIQQH